MLHVWKFDLKFTYTVQKRMGFFSKGSFFTQVVNISAYSMVKLGLHYAKSLHQQTRNVTLLNEYNNVLSISIRIVNILL